MTRTEFKHLKEGDIVRILPEVIHSYENDYNPTRSHVIIQMCEFAGKIFTITKADVAAIYQREVEFPKWGWLWHHTLLESYIASKMPKL